MRPLNPWTDELAAGQKVLMTATDGAHVLDVETWAVMGPEGPGGELLQTLDASRAVFTAPPQRGTYTVAVSATVQGRSKRLEIPFRVAPPAAPLTATPQLPSTHTTAAPVGTLVTATPRPTPVLVSPPREAELSSATVGFVWTWDDALQRGEKFQVMVRANGTSAKLADVTSSNSATYRALQLGAYEWWVEVTPSGIRSGTSRFFIVTGEQPGVPATTPGTRTRSPIPVRSPSATDLSPSETPTRAPSPTNLGSVNPD